MSEPLPTDATDPTRMHELARLLRDGGRLTPEVQQALADLVDHLADALDAPTGSTASTAAVASQTTDLLTTLHESPATTPLADVRQRLERAARAVESEAPLLTGLVLRLVETLRTMGI